jgi:hypothetical protein
LERSDNGPEGILQDSKMYKIAWSDFEHWSAATMAQRVSAMDGGEYKIAWSDFHSHRP